MERGDTCLALEPATICWAERLAGVKQFDPGEALDKAMGEFCRRGYVGTSMQDLEAATGLGRGSIYNTFGDKHALFLATLKRYIERELTKLSDQLSTAPRAADGLRLAIRSAAVHACTPDGRYNDFISRTLSDHAGRDPEATALAQRALTQICEVVEHSFRRAQAEGDFSIGRDPALAARFVITSMQGLNLMAKATEDAKLVRAIAEEVIRALD